MLGGRVLKIVLLTCFFIRLIIKMIMSMVWSKFMFVLGELGDCLICIGTKLYISDFF